MTLLARTIRIAFYSPITHLFVLFIILASMFLPHSLTGINVFDEGFIVSGAMLVKDGMLPYRDFLSVYGPGQYYVTAGIFSVLGEDLRYVRYLHVALLAALGVTVYFLANKSNENKVTNLLILLAYAGVVLFAKPNVGYPAITATLFLLFSAIALNKWVYTLQPNSLALASFMVGIAGLFRWDFGIFGLIALTLSIAFATLQENRSTGKSVNFISSIFTAMAPSLLILAVAYIPLLVIFSSPVRWYQEVPLYSLTEFAKWRNLEFVRPALWSLLESRSSLAFDKSAISLAYIFIPLALVISSISTAAYILIRRPVMQVDNNNKLFLMVYLAFLCLFLLNQMRVRPGLWQGFPALVASLPLIALLLDYYKKTILQSKLISLAINLMGFIIGAMLFNLGLNGLLESTGNRYIELNTPRASGIHLGENKKPYVDLVEYIQSNSEPDEYIYSGVQDHSRLFVNDVMLYFLTNRHPADRYMELEPGISNTIQGQQEIIDSLAKNNTRLLVLSEFKSTEPNNTSRSNGVTILDEYIRANYHFDRSFESQMIFIKN
jgi:hypothetical protein